MTRSITSLSIGIRRTVLAILLILTVVPGALAKVTITGGDETIYVTENDINPDISSTNYKSGKYVEANFTAEHDGNPVTLGLVFTIVSGDPSIIKYVKATPEKSNVNYSIPAVETKNNVKRFVIQKNANGGSGSSNTVIGNSATRFSFALSEVPKEPIVLKLYAWLNILSMDQTTFSGTPMTITIMGGAAQPEYVYGGLKHTVESHYEGKGMADLNHTATWVSGPIHTLDGIDEASAMEFDPSLHRIVAPAEPDNTADARLAVDRGHWNLSLVVGLHPDNETAKNCALTTLEMRDNATGTYAAVTEGDKPVYFQTFPSNTEYADDDARHNAPALKEGERAGTLKEFAPDHNWTDDAEATTSAQFAFDMGYRFYDNYVATNTTDGIVGKVVTYVLPAPADGATATRIANAQGTPGTDYLYKVEQPVYISDKATGVEAIEATGAAGTTTAEYYTLQGVRLAARPSDAGIYIEKRGAVAKKIAIR